MRPDGLADPRPPSAAAHEEVEFKLTAHDPAVLEELAELTELAGYGLRPAPSRTIHDRYWDTPDGELGARGLSFRLRLQDGNPLLTLKRPGSADGRPFRL